MGRVRLLYLVCTLPRTGSNLLADGLRALGAGYPIEYFHRDYRTRWDLPRDLHADARLLDRVRQLAERFATPNGAFGAKLHWFQADELLQAVEHQSAGHWSNSSPSLDRLFPNARYIWLRRLDTLRQAISYARALKSGRWWATGKQDLSGSFCQAQFDFDELQYLQSVLVQYQKNWSTYFGRIGVHPYCLTYEDLSNSYDETITSLARHLGVRVAPGMRIPASRLRKQADWRTEEWVHRYVTERRVRSSVGEIGL
jgi:trehalose 2-sulfotransferase